MLATALGLSCASLDAEGTAAAGDGATPEIVPSSGAEPVVGRLRTRNGVHDLTTSTLSADIDGHPLESMRAWAGLDRIEQLPSQSLGVSP